MHSASRDRSRHEWFQTTVRECQVFIGQAFLMDGPPEIRASAQQLIARLPEAHGREEELLLRGILICVAGKWGQLIHAAMHARVHEACRFEYSAPLECFWRDAHQPAKRVFAQWAEDFSSALALAHPVSSSQKAAAAIRADCAKAWSVGELASLVGVTPSRLSRAFVREHGFAVPEYQRRVRLLVALERISGSRVKIEAVALEVGYRSKKNFYRTFERLTGMTPTRFRQLSVAARNEIVDAAKLSMMTFNRRSALPTVPRQASASPAEQGRAPRVAARQPALSRRTPVRQRSSET